MADTLGSVGKWLVIVGIVMFVGGFLLELFGVKPAGAEAEEKSALAVIGEVITKAFKIAFSTARPIGQRLSAGGVLLIGLGLVALLGGLMVPSAEAGTGGGSAPSPTTT